MFLSEWREFPSASCLAEKKTWWQLASRCCWNRARPWHASELVSFLVGLRTYQYPGTITFFVGCVQESCCSVFRGESIRSSRNVGTYLSNHRTSPFRRIYYTYCADGIATSYKLDGPGIEFQYTQYFPHLSRLALGSTQPPVQGVWVHFAG